MGIANKKYKNTVEGKARTKIIQQKWVLSKKTMKNIDLKLISHRENDIERGLMLKKLEQKVEDVSLP